MMKIFHNPRCSKSRQGLQILEESNIDFEIVKYLDTPLTTAELKDIIDKLAIPPIKLVRKGESIWKENFKGKTLSDTEIIQAMCDYPKLIERPIVIANEKAVIGRPPSLIIDLIQ